MGVPTVSGRERGAAEDRNVFLDNLGHDTASKTVNMTSQSSHRGTEWLVAASLGCAAGRWEGATLEGRFSAVSSSPPPPSSDLSSFGPFPSR